MPLISVTAQNTVGSLICGDPWEPRSRLCTKCRERADASRTGCNASSCQYVLRRRRPCSAAVQSQSWTLWRKNLSPLFAGCWWRDHYGGFSRHILRCTMIVWLVITRSIIRRAEPILARHTTSSTRYSTAARREGNFPPLLAGRNVPLRLIIKSPSFMSARTSARLSLWILRRARKKIFCYHPTPQVWSAGHFEWLRASPTKQLQSAQYLVRHFSLRNLSTKKRTSANDCSSFAVRARKLVPRISSSSTAVSV